MEENVGGFEVSVHDLVAVELHEGGHDLFEVEHCFWFWDESSKYGLGFEISWKILGLGWVTFSGFFLPCHRCRRGRAPNSSSLKAQ